MSKPAILISIFYTLTVTWAVGQVFSWGHGGIHYVATTAIALAPTLWLLGDLADRGLHIPHVAHPLLLFVWPIALQVYVIATRKLRGFLFLILHVVLTALLNVAPFYATIYLVWGSGAFR